MQTLLLDNEFCYDGSQLRPLYAYMNHGLLGDSIVAWVGPCDVKFEHMKDGEDLRVQSPIRSDRMVHFIVEKFHTDLFGAVALQRLITAIAADLLRELSPKMAGDLRRDGDDLFMADAKLSVSIAAPSANSQLIHFAVNVINTGTPVKTCSLTDFGVDSKVFAEAMLTRISNETKSIAEATYKVFPAN